MLGLMVLVLPVSFAQEGGVLTPTASMPTEAASPPDFYVIQPGDTLWDISNRFLGDAQVWPELWSVNEYITNPHWIYPGNRIYFRLGDALNPPSAGVDEPAVASTQGRVEATVRAGESACDFPPRFERAFDGVRVSSPGVISNADELNIRGRVIAADQLGLQLGESAIVHVKMKRAAEMECGAMVAFYRRQGGTVRGANGPLGHVFRVLAEGPVLRVDGDIVTVRIRDSWSELERGDLAGDPIAVDLELDVRRPEGDLRATIVARLTMEQTLASTGETVFLDHGTNDGIDVGASLFVVERRDGAELAGPEDKRLPERVVGRVVVVRAEPGYATGVVTDAGRDIQVGARLVTVLNPE